jgi:iron complex transport system ATP-binding protein
MLRASNIGVAVPGKVLCDAFSVDICPGQCWAILGKNGVGKTSLLHGLIGLTTLSRGHVELCGQPLKRFPPRELARYRGVLLQQDTDAFWGTLKQYVTLGRHPHLSDWADLTGRDEEIVDCAMDSLHIEALSERIVATLSGGEKQLARIAMLLAQQPDYYCLDEPLQHLDLNHQVRIMNRLQSLVRDENKAVIIILHDMLWATRYCDHVVMLFGRDKVLQGHARELMNVSYLEELYQCQLEEIDDRGNRVFLPH